MILETDLGNMLYLREACSPSALLYQCMSNPQASRMMLIAGVCFSKSYGIEVGSVFSTRDNGWFSDLQQGWTGEVC